MFGTITKGGADDLKRALQRHSAYVYDGAQHAQEMLERLAPEPVLGCRLPWAKDIEFLAVHSDHKEEMHIRGRYQSRGPRFESIHVAHLRWMMFSERKEAEFRTMRAVLHDLRAQVLAHNAVVRPIDNGPDDRVYLAETGHRVSEAVRACATLDGHPDAEELQAACRANLYAADIVIANFNHHTAKD